MKLIKKLFYTILIVFLLVACFLAGYYFYATHNTALSPEKLELSNQHICIYDSENSIVQPISFSKNMQTCAIDDVPIYTQQAFISTEDKRFLSHHGFDYARIAKAAIKNVSARQFKQGASTISQQLIKNTHLTQEKTLKRKLKEWKLTRMLEKRYSKQEILEKYLNVIYFGHNCFGLQSAAAFYFNKTPKDLDLADSAILAGIIKSPNNYSPFKNPKNCQLRKESVLKGMLKNGFITSEEYTFAIQKPLPKTAHSSLENAAYLHAVFDELSVLSEEYGFPLNGQVSIHTYLEQDLQTNAENLLKEHTLSDKTVMVASTQTGGIQAYVSSVGNIARLPGSLLKPLLVYAPCLEENIISPATAILDEKINYNGYSPNNYDGTFHGYVSAREAVAKSLNIPAVKLLETLGVEKGIDYLKKMHLNVDVEDATLALALGGMKNGFTMPELIGAYGTLANQGEYVNNAFISKIVIDGQCVYERKVIKNKVFSKETAFLMTDMLKTAAKNGTAKKLRSLSFDIAAKTGTVGTSLGNTDAYAFSYTTKNVVGVWLGNANNQFIDATGGGLPCNYVLRLNELLYKNENVPPFPVPKKVSKIALDKIQYTQTHNLYVADEYTPVEYKFYEWFQNDHVPIQKSSCFSKPDIASPKIRLENGKVYIILDENSPAFYRYKIERTSQESTDVIYDGSYFKEFVDENVTAEKSYEYFITPIYENNVGKKIALPKIYVQGTPSPGIPKDWWRN